MLDNNVWVVSYCKRNWTEPIVTVYDNEEAALVHYNYLKSNLKNKRFEFAIAIDKCPIYRTFEIVKENKNG